MEFMWSLMYIIYILYYRYKYIHGLTEVILMGKIFDLLLLTIEISNIITHMLTS